MSNVDRKNGIILAAAAAALFVAAPIVANAGAHKAATEAEGQCVGGNSCKGHSACATANSGCKGQNACKGQGFTKATKAECDEAGGEFKDA
jgi:hypothetical protein